MGIGAVDMGIAQHAPAGFRPGFFSAHGSFRPVFIIGSRLSPDPVLSRSAGSWSAPFRFVNPKVGAASACRTKFA
jgi:hypothetical protein